MLPPPPLYPAVCRAALSSEVAAVKVVPRVEQPVDDDADGQAEGEAAEEGEPGQRGHGGPAQAEPVALPGDLGAGAAHSSATSGS